MGQKANRNKPCPCGSGKKYKNCCSGKGIQFNKKDQNKIFVWLTAGAGIIIAVVIISNKFSSSPSQPDPFITQPLTNQPSSSQSGNNPQPGPAPPGKVWSPDHGHWHDAPGTASASGLGDQSLQSPAQLTPQPFGPVPEGKVWSPEHGHWHDEEQTPTIQVIETNSTPSDS